MAVAKKACEVCGLADLRLVHRHHIIPRCDPRCTNGLGNIAFLCANDHVRVHAGDIVILGVYSSTSGRCLVCHSMYEEPPFPKEHWIIKDNPLVLTVSGDSDDFDPVENPENYQ